MQHSYPVKIKDIRKETSDCVSIAFDIPPDLKEIFHFKPGQYINIIKEVAGEELHRSYSLCCSPEDKEWRVAVKKMYGGKFSVYANESLKAGDLVELMPPNGKFTSLIQSGQNKNYLFIAAGSGITPVMSLIRSILQVEKESTISLLYGNSTTNHIIFRDNILDIKNQYLNRFQVHFILSREMMEEAWFTGRISGEKLNFFANKVFFPKAVDEVFICGPETMILDCKSTLESLGIADSKIHIELFGTELPSPIKPISSSEFGKSAHIRLKTDGRTTEFELEFGSTSILEAALEKKVNLPFACKGGVCCTCKAKLIEGEVEMLRNYGLEQEEINSGYILTCQAYPKTSSISVDFDQ